jgi:putative copper resistance protein D
VHLAVCLAASEQLGVGSVLLGWLFFAGLLVAAGVALFDVVVWRPLGRGGLRTGWIALGLALVFVAAHGRVHGTHAGSGRRLGLVVDVSEVLAASGAAAAAVGMVDRTAAPFALALALALLPVPTLAGHSLGHGRAWVQAPLDFLHVVAAAVWVGGVFALAVIVPRGEVAVAARRFARVALVALFVLAATGIGRTLGELASASQLWTTGYGRAIVAKSALLVVLLGAAWFSRTGRRPAIFVELALLLGVIVAVAILTATAPGVSR